MRLIVGDSETTGGSMRLGDRAIDVAAIEWRNGRATGTEWQSYLNPEGRKSHWGAVRVHGIRDSFLLDKPLFRDRMQDLLAFIGTSPFLAHNARFDADVLSVEMHLAGIENARVPFFDTIPLARRVIQQKSMSLSALQEALGIRMDRKIHGALLDSRLLGLVLEQLEERQPGFIQAGMPGMAPIVASADRGRAILGIAPEAEMQSVASSIEALCGAEPDRGPGSLAIGQLVATGLAQVIAEFNERSDPLDDATYRRLRSGRDFWSSHPIGSVAALCIQVHGRETVLAAIEALDEPKKKAALRWICRGVLPHRSSELVEFYDLRRAARAEADGWNMTP